MVRRSNPIAAVLLSGVLVSIGFAASPAEAAPSPQLQRAVLTAAEAQRATGSAVLTVSEQGCNPAMGLCGRGFDINPKARIPAPATIAGSPYESASEARKYFLELPKFNAGIDGVSVVSSSPTRFVVTGTAANFALGTAWEQLGSVIWSVGCTGPSSARVAVIRCANRLLDAQVAKAKRIS